MNNKHITFITLEATFLVTLLVTTEVLGFKIPNIPDWLTVILFTLAVLRVARTISYNEIAEPLRALFTHTEPDDCKAGMSVKPSGTGVQYAIGSLLVCPICTGMWASLVLFIIWNALPNFGVSLVWVLGIAGASEVWHWWSEKQEWQGREARCWSGHLSPDKCLEDE